MEILLTVLAVLGCIALMGVAMVVVPRVGRRLGRSPRVRRLVGRLRRQSMIDRVLSWVEEERPDLAGPTAVRHCIGEHGGYEVKSQGDGFMIAYPSARRGLECAIDMQRNLTQVDQPLPVRIGLHTGEAIREGDDFYGRSVTLAARLGDQAQGGEILTSSIVRDLVGSSADVRFEDAGELQLKALRGRQRAYRVVWEERKGARPGLRAVG
jgi:hypothetical protein